MNEPFEPKTSGRRFGPVHKIVHRRTKNVGYCHATSADELLIMFDYLFKRRFK